MLSGPVLLLMIAVLPETSSATILLRRARRLRTVTGNTTVRSQSEIDQSTLTLSDITFNALVKPWEINILDPAVLFTTIFIGLVYGIFYTYFEAFPLVYQGVYHFNSGGLSLAFLLCIVAQAVMVPLYLAHWRYVVQPGIKKNGLGPPEDFLKPGLAACFMMPAGLFVFGTFLRLDR
jgi:DHA1 family multidrug resistance protein-like MFS transporter